MLRHFQCIRRRLDTILGRFEVYLGGVRGAGARAVSSAEHFRRNRLFPPRRPPWRRFCRSRRLLGSSLALSERSLGPSWSLLGRPWGSRARLRWLLRCLLVRFGRLLGRSWAILGVLGAPDGSQDPPKRSRTSPLERKRCQTLLARARSAAGRSGKAKTIQMSSKPKFFSFFGFRRI